MSVPVGGGGPQVNKFEQVSSDHHQMSVAGGIGYLGLMSEGEVLRYPGPISRGVGVPYHVTSPTTWVPRGQTHACGNITFPKLRLRTVLNKTITIKDIFEISR